MDLNPWLPEVTDDGGRNMVGQRLRRQASNPYLFRTTLSATNQQSWSACGLENQAVVVCASRSRPVLLCGPSHLNHVKSGSHRNKTLSRFSNSTHFRVGENQFPVVTGSQSAARVQGTFWPCENSKLLWRYEWP